MAWFRNAVPVAALMTYLSSVVVGGLHHHEHGEASVVHNSSDGRGSQFAAATIQLSTPIVSTHDDGDGCALCTALHQAKTLPHVIDLTNRMAAVDEAVAFPVESPIAWAPLIHQARAPPSMS
jgi:hypothetical protein